jgi:hypothetical protein
MSAVESLYRRHQLSRCFGIVVLATCGLLNDPSSLFHSDQRAAGAAFAQTLAAQAPNPETPTAQAPASRSCR